MKKKLLTVILALVASLCLCFGLAACDFGGSTNSGNTDDPEQGDTQNPDDGSQKPDDGKQDPDDGSQNPEQGDTQDPDDGSQDPDDGEADSPYYTEGLNFTERYGEDGTTVVGYCVGVGTAVNEEHIVIPDVYLDLPVTSIGDYAFRDCSSLTSITIPESVTSIGFAAFYNCSSLTTVYWNAENCTTAGDHYFPIFKGCTQLTTVTFGENVKTIPAFAFV